MTYVILNKVMADKANDLADFAGRGRKRKRLDLLGVVLPSAGTVLCQVGSPA